MSRLRATPAPVCLPDGEPSASVRNGRVRFSGPIAWIAGAAAALAGGGGALALFRQHVSDPVVHLSPATVSERGGPVHRADLREAVDEVKAALAAESSATRKAIGERPATLRCRRDGAGLLCEAMR